jgi:hypothetical protein
LAKEPERVSHSRMDSKNEWPETLLVLWLPVQARGMQPSSREVKRESEGGDKLWAKESRIPYGFALCHWFERSDLLQAVSANPFYTQVGEDFLALIYQAIID